MEPIRLWRVRDQLGALSWITALPAVHEQAWRDLIESEWVASPRADFDALVKERDDWRDTSMAAYAAAHGLDWQSLTKEQLDAMEADGKAHGDKKSMDVVRRLYAKWNAAVYDADKVRTERDRAEREWHAATARADAASERLARAEALLREARDSVERDYFECDTRLTPEARKDRLARIDAILEGKA